MSRTRYREERTLVRGLRRLPGEDRGAFKEKVNRLRKHFQRFNLDVSELSQWIMSLRPSGRVDSEDTRQFWECVLEPEEFVNSQDQTDIDWFRLAILQVGIGISALNSLSHFSLSEGLLNSIRSAALRPRSESAARMIKRFYGLSRAHRMVLAKAAAEYIMTRYMRGNENWRRQREEWEREKADWEKRHPELTEDIRNEYTAIFKNLGITNKRPRVCSWKRLGESKDNCEYAGERFRCGGNWQNHSPLCAKYRNFQATLRQHRRHFVENATRYLKLRNKPLSKQDAFARLFREVPAARGWFADAWDKYLQSLGITEETIQRSYAGELPHCLTFDGKSECSFNPHTNECEGYRKSLQSFPEWKLNLEGLYREWRRDYLAGPARPSFRYPSSRTLPVPKIFGRGFYEIDFENSRVRLRLDDMAEGQYVVYGFKPWPKDYDFQPDRVDVTSVCAHFVGTRARIGFRFVVAHKQSRFRISQDQIDELRSRTYPRASQDQNFLDEVRLRLLESFPCPPADRLRILTVDLGTAGGAASVFAGKELKKSYPLRVVKLDKLYEVNPDPTGKGGDTKGKDGTTKRGLSKDHVAAHLEGLAKASTKITGKRQQLTEINDETAHSTLGSYDMRRLTLHIGWMIRDWVRLNASQIISLAERENIDLIVLESMRGFRAPGYDKLDEDKKRRLAFFAYGAIRRKIAEKAVERGMRVVTVPYLYSSQVCSECGARQENKMEFDKNKRKRKFICESKSCGHTCNSDENAARVLSKVFWGDIRLPVK